MHCTLHDLEILSFSKIKGVHQVKLGPIGGYIVTIGGYGAPLKQHRENTACDYSGQIVMPISIH